MDLARGGRFARGKICTVAADRTPPRARAIGSTIGRRRVIYRAAFVASVPMIGLLWVLVLLRVLPPTPTDDYVVAFLVPILFVPAVAFWDDIYISPSQARVEICDAPTWAQCKNREIQPASAWSGTSITVKLNRGALASFAKTYLYVVDQTGAMNANGFAL